MNADNDLTADVLDLLDRARSIVTDYDDAVQLDEAIERLHGPLRIAFAGKLKAGKSTLLNAIIGEELAATDAGECTRIVTWYSRQSSPEITVHLVDGRSTAAAWTRGGGALEIDLSGHAADEIDRIEIGWPTGQLQHMTLVDTPGIASIVETTSERTHRVLETVAGRAPTADAVVYLMAHVHAKDVRFLESFHDDEVAHGTPMNSVGVLARADEIGSCRLDAMQTAARIARRYQSEPRMRRLCPIVLPVNGLLAHAGGTLREDEYKNFAKLAQCSADELGPLLLTVDRFVKLPLSVAVTELERAHLLERFGIFGVRLALELIQSGRVGDSVDLAEELSRRSGLGRLRQVLTHQFAQRSQLLKARSALATLSTVLERSEQTPDTTRLLDEVEQIHATRHEFAEVRMLTSLRTQPLALKPQRLNELDQILGGSGHDPASRLGLPPDSDPRTIRAAALDALPTWQRLAEHPVRSVQVAARIATRTLEGMIPADQPDATR